MTEQIYRHNLKQVEESIVTACQRVGRNPSHVRLIAVTKSVEPTEVGPLLDAGLSEFAENRWQVAKPKLEQARSNEATWHFIGSLQQNKVKYVVPRFAWIHSVDSVELGQAISQEAIKLNRQVEVLVQVNIAREAQKHGIEPGCAADAVATLFNLPGIRVRGLMTMAPRADNPEVSRPVFAGLAQLLQQLQKNFDKEIFNQLSMGMSEDFPIAVEEGATMVRVGQYLMQPAPSFPTSSN